MCSYNIPYPDVEYKYWNIQDQIFVFLDADENVVSKVYQLKFIDGNTLEVLSYQNWQTYTLTRE